MINSINTNIAAYYAQQNINIAGNNTSLSVARLSSGNRIVKASDDVASLAAGTSLATNVNTLKVALTNASQGSSLLQVADGALAQIITILQRQKAISVQAGSGSLSNSDRAFLNQEFQQLTAEIDQISGGTNFNGVQLINGGLGTSTHLAIDATAAANYDPTAVTGSTAATAVASTSPIQAFTSLGADQSIGGGATVGGVDITDSTGTLLTTGYDGVNGALHGQFSGFSLSNVVYGSGTGSGTLTASINGVDFSGSIADGDTSATLHNGNSYIKINFTAIDLTDSNSTANSTAQMSVDFDDTYLERTSTITGVDFTGTRLGGAIGSAAYGVASSRLYDSNASISDFKYGGNTGAADTNIITVQVNGQTFSATGLLDAFASATPSLAFQSTDGQSLVVDLTPSGTTVWGDFTNIRTNQDDQTALINALNIGFSRAGGGLNFAVGSASSDNIKVQLGSASSTNLFNGQSLDVATSASAQAASEALDVAIASATALRSTAFTAIAVQFRQRQPAEQHPEPGCRPRNAARYRYRGRIDQLCN